MFGPDDFEVQIQQENPPGIHAEPSIPPAQDEEYGDFIVKHGQNMGGKFLPVNELFGILYIPLNEMVRWKLIPIRMHLCRSVIHLWMRMH